jgi:hypothetical protein
MNEQWGLCKDCKWWQIEPDGSAENTTMGLCIDEDIQQFQLRVSGNSGCNRFMAGKPARAKDPADNRRLQKRHGEAHRIRHAALSLQLFNLTVEMKKSFSGGTGERFQPHS